MDLFATHHNKQLEHFLSRPPSRVNRCFSSTMDKPKTVCIPAIHLARENNSQNMAGECEGSSGHHPDIGESVMVSTAIGELS